MKSLVIAILLICSTAHANSCIDQSLKDNGDEVGLRKALANASSCLEFNDPAVLGCKRFGTAEGSIEHWLLLADKRALEIAACKPTEDKPEEVVVEKYTGDDGSMALGLAPGSIVNQIQDGENLFAIVSGSPFAKKLSPSDLIQLQKAMSSH